MPRLRFRGASRRALVVVAVTLAAVVTLVAPAVLSALSAPSESALAIGIAAGSAADGAGTSASLRDHVRATAAGADTVASLQEQVRDATLDTSHGRVKTCGWCMSWLVAAAPGAERALSTDNPVGWGADDLAAALHLPAQDTTKGRRGTVAVLTGGAYPTEESDLAAYRAHYVLPACTIANGCLTITDLNGGPPLQPANAKYDQAGAVEAALDVDMASASCPSCRILDVQIPAEDGIPGPVKQLHKAMGDIAHAVDTAITLGADAVSMSIGFPNDNSPEAQASEHPPHWTVADGTSLSSPFIAGLYARGGRTAGVLGPNTIYSASGGAFTDVTTGTNVNPEDGQATCPADAPALCEAGPGWDGPTGVGTPNGLSGF